MIATPRAISGWLRFLDMAARQRDEDERHRLEREAELAVTEARMHPPEPVPVEEGDA